MTQRHEREAMTYRLLYEYLHLNKTKFESVPDFLEWFYQIEENNQQLDRLSVEHRLLSMGKSATTLEAEELTYEVANAARVLFGAFAERMMQHQDRHQRAGTQGEIVRMLDTESYFMAAFTIQSLEPLLTFLSETGNKEEAKVGISNAIADLTLDKGPRDEAQCELAAIRRRVRNLLQWNRAIVRDSIAPLLQANGHIAESLQKWLHESQRYS